MAEYRVLHSLRRFLSEILRYYNLTDNLHFRLDSQLVWIIFEHDEYLKSGTALTPLHCDSVHRSFVIIDVIIKIHYHINYKYKIISNTNIKLQTIPIMHLFRFTIYFRKYRIPTNRKSEILININYVTLRFISSLQKWWEAHIKWSTHYTSVSSVQVSNMTK